MVTNGCSLVGILNVTPDSFSDGGTFVDPEAVVVRVVQMVSERATVIDIGAESTRPGATPLTHEEEWLRLEPILRAVLTHVACEISVDTRHPQTAEKALALGVHWINDVSGFSQQMVDVVKNSKCRLVVMHSLSVPARKDLVFDETVDVVEAVRDWCLEKLAMLERHGIARERIIFDPGIGFGKTAEQSMKLIERVSYLKVPGTQLLVGHSRKSFLTTLGIKSLAERDEATGQLSAFLATQGVDYVRVHNVAVNRLAMKMLV